MKCTNPTMKCTLSLIARVGSLSTQSIFQPDTRSQGTKLTHRLRVPQDMAWDARGPRAVDSHPPPHAKPLLTDSSVGTASRENSSAPYSAGQGIKPEEQRDKESKAKKKCNKCWNGLSLLSSQDKIRPEFNVFPGRAIRVPKDSPPIYRCLIRLPVLDN